MRPAATWARPSATNPASEPCPSRFLPTPRNAHRGDRIIVAAAEVLGAPLVSAAGKVPAMASVRVVW